MLYPKILIKWKTFRIVENFKTMKRNEDISKSYKEKYRLKFSKYRNLHILLIYYFSS